MQVRVINAGELSSEDVAHWTALQDAQPDLESPFFAPEFIRAVARVRNGVFVAVLEEGGRPFGYFPFQRQQGRTGKPAGWPMSNYQGVIASPASTWNARDLVRGCGLRAYEFDHLLVSQAGFVPFHSLVSPSPIMDLRRGFDAYAEERSRAGWSVLGRRVATKRNKLEREVGPIRFLLHDPDSEPLEALLRWKSLQYQKTGGVDLFSFDWPVRLLDELRQLQTGRFAGVLSTLYAGETLVAVHMGMRCGGVWHYWYPAYDPAYHAYSPGYFLLVEMARGAADAGLSAIDLGKGDMEYKTRLASYGIPVAQGLVPRSRFSLGPGALWRCMGAAVNRIPSRLAWDLPGRVYRYVERRRRIASVRRLLAPDRRIPF